jgi:hypothetical protein
VANAHAIRDVGRDVGREGGEGVAPPSTRLAGLGTMVGTPIVGSIDFFLQRYGRAAAHETIARVPPRWREYLRPHAPQMGILGSRRYPYSFIGDLIRTMITVVRPNEDAFVRDLAIAGLDASLNTAMRVLLRLAATPASLAERANEGWRMFHDTGVVHASVNDREYVTEIVDWANHDVMVCKITVEVRRRLIERTGRSNVTVRREKCQAWGHEVCSSRVRWTA